jgi:polyisoprenoid-binding protein YceI
MRKIFFCVIFLFSCLAGSSQTVFISDSGEVTFYSYALLEDIKASSKSVNSIINIVSNEVAFMIPMRSFQFAKALMQEHFNEKYLESDKYPQAMYKGNINEKLDYSKPGTYPVTTKGQLTIHGVQKEINEKGELTIDSGTLVLNTKFFVALQDYNIIKPSLMFNNIADTIEVKLKAVYIPFKKK